MCKSFSSIHHVLFLPVKLLCEQNFSILCNLEREPQLSFFLHKPVNGAWIIGLDLKPDNKMGHCGASASE